MYSNVSIRAKEKKEDKMPREKRSRGNECRCKRKIRHALPGSTHDYWVERIHERTKTRRDGSNHELAPFHPWHSSFPLTLSIMFSSVMFSSCRKEQRATCSSWESYSTILAEVALPWASREFNGRAINAWGWKSSG